jgi:glutamate 5-kinase
MDLPKPYVSGTSSIISSDPPFLPHLSLLSAIVEATHHLRSLGHRVVLVSSGAIGVGMRTMELKERGKGLQRKQALAAIGQGRLIALWDQLFGLLDVKIAQVLLTRQDISDVSASGEPKIRSTLTPVILRGNAT